MVKSGVWPRDSVGMRGIEDVSAEKLLELSQGASLVVVELCSHDGGTSNLPMVVEPRFSAGGDELLTHMQKLGIQAEGKICSWQWNGGQ